MPPGGNGRGPARPRTPSAPFVLSQPLQPVGLRQDGRAQPAGKGIDPEQARSSGAAKPNGPKSPPPAGADRQRQPMGRAGAAALGPDNSSPVQPKLRGARVDVSLPRHRSASSLPLDPVPFEAEGSGDAGSRPAGRAAPVARSLRAADGSPYPASAERIVPGGGEPNPSLSGRPIEGIGASLMEQKPEPKPEQKPEQKRITPRSPRAALEPEQVSVPTRRSGRARNPFVIAGNAVFTLLILLVLAGAAAFAVGKGRFEAPGPLEEDKVVNIPPRLGLIEIADLLRHEGVMKENNAIFIGSVFALKARTELKFGEYLFAKHASVRDVLETMVEGKVVQHAITVPEGLTSEQTVQICSITTFSTAPSPPFRAKAACCRGLTTRAGASRASR